MNITIELELFSMLFALAVFLCTIGLVLKENGDTLWLPTAIGISLFVYFFFYGILCSMGYKA